MGPSSIYWLSALLLLSNYGFLAVQSQAFNCIGGLLSFIAHPDDDLLL